MYWESNKPIMMGHYGKSYAKILKTSINKSGESTQGHPTVESGMPMLQVVPSVDRWTTYGVFKSPEGMDNFFNIAFDSKDSAKIKIDGKTLSSAFGSSMRFLPGTPYAYIRTPIASGDHVVQSESDDIKFVAWTYGSLDGLQQGRAYGTPVSIDLAIPCPDSLVVNETIFCGNVKGVGQILPIGIACGSAFAVYAEVEDNYKLVVDESFSSGDEKVDFFVNVLDKTKDANATIKIVARSGKFVEKKYSYIADKIDWTPKDINWGTIAFNTPESKEFTLTNLRSDSAVNVKLLRAKYYPEVYSFSPSSFTIAPGGSQIVTVTAVTQDAREKLDTVIAELDCFNQQTVEIRVRSEEPIIYVSDKTWTNVPASSPGIPGDVEIRNASDVELIILGYDETLLPTHDDGVAHFYGPTNLREQLPITLHGGEKHVFTVLYSPRGDCPATHRVDVPFYSNADKADSIAILIGTCSDTTTSVSENGNSQISITPLPVVLSQHQFVTITSAQPYSRLRVYDVTGREVYSMEISVGVCRVPTSAFAASGMYAVRLSSANNETVVPIMCFE